MGQALRRRLDCGALRADLRSRTTYGVTGMHVILLNYIYDAEYPTADALLGRYLSLSGWAESLRAAGAERVTVLQRFRCDVDMRRNGVEYRFRAGRGAH